MTKVDTMIITQPPFLMSRFKFLARAIAFLVVFSFVTGEAINVATSGHNVVRRERSIRGSQRQLVSGAPSGAPIPIPIRPRIEYSPNECLKDWISLKSAMILAAVLNPGLPPEFTLCPGQLFLLDSLESGGSSALQPIDVQNSNSVFRCGDDGKLENNCLIVGGYAHFKMIGSVKDVKFQGITFSGARLSSILAAGESDAVVEFVDCAWIDNNGDSAVLIYNEEKGVPITSKTNVVDLVEPRAKSMTVYCSGCLFTKNNMNNSTVVNLSGEFILNDSVFAENNVLGGVIISRFDSTLSIEDSCFLRNKAELAGIVVVDERSTAELNKNTYGDENEIGYGTCEEVFYEIGDSCVGGSNPKCVGLCGFFTASNGCSVNLLKLDALSDLIEDMYPERPGEGGSESGLGNKIFGLDPVGILVGGGFAIAIIVLCCMGCSFRFGQKSVFAKYAAVPIRDDTDEINNNRPTSDSNHCPVVATVTTAEPVRPTRPVDNCVDDLPPTVEEVKPKEPMKTSASADNFRPASEEEVKPKKPIKTSASAGHLPLASERNEKGKTQKERRKSDSTDVAFNGNDSDDSNDTEGAFFKQKKKKKDSLSAKRSKKTDSKKDDDKATSKKNDSKRDSNKRSEKKTSKSSDAGTDEESTKHEKKEKKVNEKDDKKPKSRSKDKSRDQDKHDENEDDVDRSSRSKSSRGKKKKNATSDTEDDNVGTAHKTKSSRDKKKVTYDSDDDDADGSPRSSKRKSSRDKKQKSSSERVASDTDDDDDDETNRSSSKSKSSRDKKKEATSDIDEDGGGKHHSSSKSKPSHDEKKKKVSSSDTADDDGKYRSSSKSKPSHGEKKKTATSDTADDNGGEHRSSTKDKNHEKDKTDQPSKANVVLSSDDERDTSRRGSASSASSRDSSIYSADQSKRLSIGSGDSGTSSNTATSIPINEVTHSKKHPSRYQSREKKRNSIDFAGVKERRTSLDMFVKTYYAVPKESESKQRNSKERATKDRSRSPAPGSQKKDGKEKRSKARSVSPTTSKRGSMGSKSSNGSKQRNSKERAKRSKAQSVSPTTAAKRGSMDSKSSSESKQMNSKDRTTTDRSRSPDPRSQRKDNKEKRSKERSVSPTTAAKRGSMGSKSSSASEGKDGSRRRSKRGSLGSSKSSSKKANKSSREKSSKFSSSAKETRKSLKDEPKLKSTSNFRGSQEEAAATTRRKSRASMSRSLSGIEKSESRLKKEKLFADMAKITRSSLNRSHKRGSRDRFGSSTNKRNECLRKPLNTSTLKPFSLRDLKATSKVEDKEDKK